jgi:hypothetical protein
MDCCQTLTVSETFVSDNTLKPSGKSGEAKRWCRRVRPTLPCLKTVPFILCAALAAVGTVSLPTTAIAASVTPTVALSADAPAIETTAYHSVAPRRLADTRPTSPSGFQRVDTTTVRVTVDPTAQAAAFTVTAVNTTAAGFVTVWPTGTPRPSVSNINIGGPAETRANSVVVRLGTAGAVDVYVDAKVPRGLPDHGWALRLVTGEPNLRYPPSCFRRVICSRQSDSIGAAAAWSAR